ncbi:hypothetical protein RvY_04753 [Ramazzottius varieornatus]|uniref:Uncharacterized protein n=1 Tax=Ramazzottius varieornatus TaxID=947166 RepID=A0A1D1UW55_RAMVA|nr:hypothetical protein RvY_04753 [Ramazzottius varieornatus]
MLDGGSTLLFGGSLAHEVLGQRDLVQKANRTPTASLECLCDRSVGALSVGHRVRTALRQQ